MTYPAGLPLCADGKSASLGTRCRASACPPPSGAAGGGVRAAKADRRPKAYGGRLSSVRR